MKDEELAAIGLPEPNIVTKQQAYDPIFSIFDSHDPKIIGYRMKPEVEEAYRLAGYDSVDLALAGLPLLCEEIPE